MLAIDRERAGSQRLQNARIVERAVDRQSARARRRDSASVVIRGSGTIGDGGCALQFACWQDRAVGKKNQPAINGRAAAEDFQRCRTGRTVERQGSCA